MSNYFSKYFLLFLFAISSLAASLIPGENLVKKFPYRKYLGKDFQTFYGNFKSESDTQKVIMMTHCYQPQPGKVIGIEINAGYCAVIAYFKYNHYFTPNWEHPDTCLEWDCPQFDTAKLRGFEIRKDNIAIKKVGSTKTN